jgi:hypothetical protein
VPLTPISGDDIAKTTILTLNHFPVFYAAWVLNQFAFFVGMKYGQLFGFSSLTEVGGLRGGYCVAVFWGSSAVSASWGLMLETDRDKVRNGRSRTGSLLFELYARL